MKQRITTSDKYKHLVLHLTFQRISAEDAVAHPWFVEDPAPTPMECMPKFDSRHGES